MVRIALQGGGLTDDQGVRAELAKQGTLVVGVMPGAIDTDVERDYKGHKENPYDVAVAALDAVEKGIEDVYPGQMAGGVSRWARRQSEGRGKGVCRLPARLSTLGSKPIHRRGAEDAEEKQGEEKLVKIIGWLLGI